MLDIYRDIERFCICERRERLCLSMVPGEDGRRLPEVIDCMWPPELSEMVGRRWRSL